MPIFVDKDRILVSNSKDDIEYAKQNNMKEMSMNKKDKSWSKKEILLLTYSISIIIFTISLILYIAL